MYHVWHPMLGYPLMFLGVVCSICGPGFIYLGLKVGKLL